MDGTSSPRVVITRLTFKDGTEIPLSPKDVVLVVGPNNAGKSEMLRAIKNKLSSPANNSPVIQQLEIQRLGNLDIFKNWLLEKNTLTTTSMSADLNVSWLGHSLQVNAVCEQWLSSDNSLGSISRWFCHLLTADERLQISNPPKNFAVARESPVHPIQFLLCNGELEKRLSLKFRRAFGMDLIVHRNAGNEIPLHVGERPKLESGEENPVSVEYAKQLSQLPTLHTQGDGMRSFAGVLLATSVGEESIMLIDEPEAFLHPPQARLLGMSLVQDRIQARQLFIATHNTDVLLGVLNAESSDVKVLRIQREGSTNKIRLLDNAQIQELWRDPILRYSKVLDGLFHEGVIVCESDADCRFYAAVLDAVMASQPEDAKQPDWMFTHCGGKARLPVLIKALREVGVPVRVVADFDVLADKNILEPITNAFGVAWPDVEKDWKPVKTSIDNKKPELNLEDVKKEICMLLQDMTPNTLTKVKADIQQVFKRYSPWQEAKRSGKSYVPSGDPSQACKRLLSKLGDAGLHIVEVGELESFVRAIGNHGPAWVNAVLERELGTDPDLEGARKFVQVLAGIDV
jgi:predicted ATPase